MSLNAAAARKILSNIEIPEPDVVPQGAEKSPFTSGTDQAAVVGQDIFAFMSGTEPALRDAISDSALLAQMVADSRVTDRDDMVGWYDAYFGMLKSLGWLVQDGGWSEVSETSNGFEVHEKILDIAAVLLTGAPTALAVIASTLGALKAASDDSPWITLFHKRSIKGKSARFQIGVVDAPLAGGAPLVSMMAFALKAETVVTKVLLFKVTKNRASLRTNSAKISLDLAAVQDLAPDIRDKLRGWQRLLVQTLPDLELPPSTS